MTFNRPESANALNHGFMEEIEHVSKSFLYDEETRVVVFAAAGKHYCAGWDFKEPPPKERPSLLLKRRETGLGRK